MTNPVDPTLSPEPPELSLQQAWQTVLGQLQADMSRADYDSYVVTARPLAYQDQLFILAAATPYARDWLSSRLKSRVATLLTGVYSQPVGLQIIHEERPGPAGVEMPRPKKARREEEAGEDSASRRKEILHRAYGSERARIILPERTLFITWYFFDNWMPLLGHSAAMVVMAARAMCYWNPMKENEIKRNEVEIMLSDLAERAAVSLRTLKTVLKKDEVRRNFIRYKVRKVHTPNGVRTAGVTLYVRMDDPLIPAHQEKYNLPEPDRWYPDDYEDAIDLEDAENGL